MRVTTATKITFLRLFLVPFLIFFILRKDFKMGLVVFVLAVMTDGLDGLIARKFNQRSAIGAILDPAADKILMLSTFLTLSFPAVVGTNRIPKWLVIAIITRDLIIVSGALFLRVFLSVKSFSPSIWGKLTTGAESFTASFALLGNAISQSFQFLLLFYYLTLFFVLISAIHYSWRGVSIIIRRSQ